MNSDYFIRLLQNALDTAIGKQRLLQQPQILRKIMNDIPARHWLHQQVLAFAQTNPSNTTPNPALTLTVEIMQSSRAIWRGGLISPDIYEEAISRTQEWFLQNAAQRYDSQQASFVTWFNNKLRHTINGIIREKAREKAKFVMPTSALGNDENSEWIFPPAPSPDQWQNTIEEWLELTERSQELKDKQMQKYPHINCQQVLIVILNKLKSTNDFDWNTCFSNDEVSPDTLKRFCKRRCLVCFKRLVSD